MAKILIPALCNASPHQETELEIIEKHLREGDEIYYIQCKRNITNCFLWQYPSEDICIFCQKRFSVGVSLLSQPINILTWPKDSELQLRGNLSFKNTQELKNFSIDGVNIGLCVASTLISEFADENFNTEAHKDIIQDNLYAAHYIYKSFIQIIKKIQPDLVYLFNGRHTTEAPIIMACKEKDIPYYTHEVGHTYFKYRLVYNDLPHATLPIEDECKNIYKRYGHEQALLFAQKNYTLRRSGNTLAGRNFIQQQNPNALPDGFDTRKKNIIFYNSSFFEFAALPGFASISKIYPSEDVALSQVAQDCADDPQIHIYCRMHPNLSGKNTEQISKLRSITNKFPNLTIIPPESSVDSYALMEQAKIIVTFHSTMGEEASFWGKPVIIIGLAAYRHLEGFYRPSSHAELIKLLHSDLSPLPPIGAIKYGLWMQQGGISYKYYTPTTRYSGKFKGVDIDILAKKYLFINKLYKLFIDIFGINGHQAATIARLKLKKNISLTQCRSLLHKLLAK